MTGMNDPPCAERPTLTLTFSGLAAAAPAATLPAGLAEAAVLPAGLTSALALTGSFADARGVAGK
jgi:hypothetical protein